MSNHVCPSWVGYFFLLNPLRRLFENPVKILSSFITQNMVVIEPGCGMGYFTLPLAQMVGPKGRVIAVDIQDKMLSALNRRAQKAGLSDRIEIRKATPKKMGLDDLKGKTDMVVAIHMVHEVPDQHLFYQEAWEALKVQGKLLVIEPKGHVSRKKFEKSLTIAHNIGFTSDPLSKNLSGRKALLYKPKNE